MKGLEPLTEKTQPFKSYIAYAGVPLLRRMIVEAITDEGVFEYETLPNDWREKLRPATDKNDYLILATERACGIRLKQELDFAEPWDPTKLRAELKSIDPISNIQATPEQKKSAQKIIEILIEILRSIAQKEALIYSLWEKHKDPDKTTAGAATRILKSMLQIAYELKGFAYFLDHKKFIDPTNRLVNILGYFPQSSDSPNNEVLCAKPKETYPTFSRFWPPHENAITAGDSEIKNIETQFNSIHGHSFRSEAAVLVLYDRDSSFRNYFISQKETLKPLMEKATDGIVIGITENLDNSEWLKTLSECATSYKHRCIVIITADALRKSGIDITVNGSLEQAVHQVVGCLHKEKIKLFDKICDHLVVLFRETLVVHVSKEEEKLQGTVHIAPNFKRVMEAEQQAYGRMPGKFSIMLTAIVKKLYHNGIDRSKNSNPNPKTFDSLKEAIPLGISACNSFFDKGFCHAETSGDSAIEVAPFDAFTQSLNYQQRKTLFSDASKKKDFRISTLAFSIRKDSTECLAVNSNGNRWSRIDSLFEKVTTEKMLLHIVRQGIGKATRNAEESDGTPFENKSFPRATISCPYAEFGSRKTFDEREAREFYALENLLRKYITTPDWKAPLSIAVFGYPGTGKSSTVEEILKNVMPGTVKPEVFNLAQFSSIEQLTEAFHKVQDLGLTGEKCPVIVFDEFDASIGGTKLGWLKYFLAPMQDGTFLGQTTTYHIRRAIFIFTGGTHPTFKSFASASDDNQAKLKDFTSRLKGYLDVQSINRVDKQGKEIPFRLQQNGSISHKDRPLLLRRAILLRSLLEKHAEPILKNTKETGSTYVWRQADIKNEVIKAFLCAGRYKHGTRSMEAIIQMSRWINEAYVPASLPPSKQLEAHVIGNSFKKLLQS